MCLCVDATCIQGSEEARGRHQILGARGAECWEPKLGLKLLINCWAHLDTLFLSDKRELGVLFMVNNLRV